MPLSHSSSLDKSLEDSGSHCQCGTMVPVWLQGLYLRMTEKSVMTCQRRLKGLAQNARFRLPHANQPVSADNVRSLQKKKKERKYGMQKATVKLCNKPPWRREFLWKVVTIKKGVCVMSEATLSHHIHAPDSPRPTATQPANCEQKLRTPSVEIYISSRRKASQETNCPEG